MLTASSAAPQEPWYPAALHPVVRTTNLLNIKHHLPKSIGMYNQKFIILDVLLHGPQVVLEREFEPFRLDPRASVPCRSQADVVCEDLGVLSPQRRSEFQGSLPDVACSIEVDREVPVPFLEGSSNQNMSVWLGAGNHVCRFARWN